MRLKISAIALCVLLGSWGDWKLLTREPVFGGRPDHSPPGIDYAHPDTLEPPLGGPPLALRFAVFGDWGEPTRPHDQVCKGLRLIDRAFKERQLPLHAVLLAGDNFYPSGVEARDDPRWESLWGKPLRPLNLPFYAVLGNHDYRDHRGPSEDRNIAAAQFQIDQTGRPGFELWHMRDTNGAATPGVWFTEWFSTEALAVQIIAIDSNTIIGQAPKLSQQAPAQLAWLVEQLHAPAPHPHRARPVARIVLGHHPVALDGDKEAEIAFINSPEAPHGPRGRTLKEILAEDANAYLCGHSHTVAYLDLADRKVRPDHGPIHGTVRRLDAPTPLQIISGTAGDISRHAVWGDSGYYVSQIAGFTLLCVGVDPGGELSMEVQFVDCRKNKPRVIYALQLPLRDLQSSGTAEQANELTDTR